MATDAFDRLLRRSFLGRMAAGVGGLGAVFGGAGAVQARAAGPAPWQPVRHPEDDWLDTLHGQHRLVFDTTSPESLGYAIRYANNFFNANQNGYGLKDADLAVVIVARHFSTPFAFSDAVWAKHGAVLSDEVKFVDPSTKAAPSVNLFGLAGRGLSNQDVTLDSLLKRGLHLGVCGIATRRYARRLAGRDGNAEAVYKELASSLLPNAHMAAAGIVVVNRAQERGYSFATTG